MSIHIVIVNVYCRCQYIIHIVVVNIYFRCQYILLSLIHIIIVNTYCYCQYILSLSIYIVVVNIYFDSFCFCHLFSTLINIVVVNCWGNASGRYFTTRPNGPKRLKAKKLVFHSCSVLYIAVGTNQKAPTPSPYRKAAPGLPSESNLRCPIYPVGLTLSG